MKNMKYIGVLAGAMLVSLVAVQKAQALPLVTGSIGFAGSYTDNNPGNLGLATSVTGINVDVDDASGAFSPVPNTLMAGGPQYTYLASAAGGPSQPNAGSATASGSTYATPGLFNNFTFNTPVVPVNPLWSLEIGGVIYSFEALTMTATYDAGQNAWAIGGSGTATVTGYATTGGIWDLTLSQSGSSFGFTSNTTVPDGGLTVALLGGALIGLQVLRRKLLC